MKRLIICMLLVVMMVGVVSADTLLKYLDEDTADEYMGEATDSSWTTMRNAVGDYSGDGNSGTLHVSIEATTTTERYTYLERLGYGYNTSTIPDDATITGVISSHFMGTKSAVGLSSQPLGITGFSPADVKDFTYGDYDSFGNTRYATDIPYTSVTSNARLNITWNAEGIANISKTGYTNFMLRLGSDIDNSNSTLIWSSGGYSGYRVRDYTESADRYPFLEITYTTGGVSAPVASFTCTKNFLRIPNSVTCTDSSTNTPTSWEWSWGDGTANSTTQNPTHQYTKRGKWDIILTATNAGGSGSTGATSIKVVGYENYY